MYIAIVSWQSNFWPAAVTAEFFWNHRCRRKKYLAPKISVNEATLSKIRFRGLIQMRPNVNSFLMHDRPIGCSGIVFDSYAVLQKATFSVTVTQSNYLTKISPSGKLQQQQANASKRSSSCFMFSENRESFVAVIASLSVL